MSKIFEFIACRKITTKFKLVENLIGNMYFIFGFLLLLLSACGTGQDLNLQKIDFDTSLGKNHQPFRALLKNRPDAERYSHLKAIWEERQPVLRQNSKKEIPKMLHQIWLGPKPLPDFFEEYQRSWKELHPDWEYRLWRDEDVKKLNLELSPLINDTSNYAEKSDLLRLELLLRFGGVYVDVDCRALKAFDQLVERYDFFTGLEPPHSIGERSDRQLFICNAIIAAAPNHPILLDWKKKIKEKWILVGSMDVDYVQKVLLRTFLTFGDAIDETISTNRDSIVFPPTYFFPIMPPNYSVPLKAAPSAFKRALYWIGIKKPVPFTCIQNETYMVHDFAGTWQEKRYRNKVA